MNNIFLYKLFIGVKKINGHSGVNFSFNRCQDSWLSQERHLQSTPDNSNPQGKLKKVRVIGSSSYRKLRTNDRKKGKSGVYCFSVHTMYILE